MITRRLSPWPDTWQSTTASRPENGRTLINDRQTFKNLYMQNEILTGKKMHIPVKFRKIAWALLIGGITAVTLYYLWTRAVIYFRVSPQVYTDYFWYRAPWLLVHVICGIIATTVGALQFLPFIRARNIGLHRNLGRIYLSCVAISTSVSFYLASTSHLGFVYAAGLASLGVVWFVSSAMAFICIRNGNVSMHKEWMIKSYVLTLSFVWFRAIEDLLAAIGVSNFLERKVLMSWASWAIPFFVTVVILDVRKLLRKTPRPKERFIPAGNDFQTK
jgi:uncharacterized membrane protein